MGSDLYMNPPTDPCSKCKAQVVDLYPGKLCVGCYIRKLKRKIRRLTKFARLAWVGSDKDFRHEFEED